MSAMQDRPRAESSINRIALKALGMVLVIPALPALQGLTLHHAAVFVDGAFVVGASQAVPLSLLP